MNKEQFISEISNLANIDGENGFIAECSMLHAIAGACCSNMEYLLCSNISDFVKKTLMPELLKNNN